MDTPSETNCGRGLLEGIRIVDFSRVLAGPYCSALLGDLGAEVIKVEPPQGDDQRQMGVIREGESVNFALLNRGKKSVCLDLKTPEGLDAARRLAATADAVIENFRPGVAARLGISYDDLRQVKPDLIYCSISGFGQEGPLSKRPSYDVIAQAMSGMMSITGAVDGPPMLVGDAIADVSAGMFAAFGIAIALFHRERSGEGQYLDVAMLDSLLTMMPTALARYQGLGEAPGRSGNRHPLTEPFGAYTAKDGQFIVAAANNSLFARLCGAIGRPEWVTDPRFASVQSRTANRAVLAAGLEGWAAERTVEEVVEALLAAKVPSSPIWDLAVAAESAHCGARGVFRPLAHDVFGGLRAPEQPVHFAGWPRGIPTRAPARGADTEAVLGNLPRMDPDRIARLSRCKVDEDPA
ncbi:Crotonobetainyl-CoA:carnitine CoA-transferase CaiB [Salinihabitans flavidus]|uniref:Crotonobetainyl-CoA:carnitine CoA-transferase CaiB n=1 Tax=Salinihabitans flavidus TaxID=569882 RepID=A0A1H8UJS0_9RHOB|nr:CoA transferase [Salinihabitans flavidus]SEP03435.1 Crotonobetainyl-CoA:carnitine CoA-transferase CaiB [Salinihabitans flavidus]